MGIFDRFRSAGKTANDAKGKAGESEQRALSLIDEAHTHEANGRIDEAINCHQARA